MIKLWHNINMLHAIHLGSKARYIPKVSNFVEGGYIFGIKFVFYRADRVATRS